jgi:hypothetical protein
MLYDTLATLINRGYQTYLKFNGESKTVELVGNTLHIKPGIPDPADLHLIATDGTMLPLLGAPVSPSIISPIVSPSVAHSSFIVSPMGTTPVIPVFTSQSVFTPQPSQTVFAPQPSQPMFTPQPSQPMFTPQPSQPVFAPQPSQAMTSTAIQPTTGRIQTVTVPAPMLPTFTRSSAVVPQFNPTVSAQVPLAHTPSKFISTATVGPDLGKMAIRFSVSNTGQPLNAEGSYIILTDAGKNGLVEIAPYKFPVGMIQLDPETTRQLRSQLASNIIQTVRPRRTDKLGAIQPYEFVLTEGKPNNAGTGWVIKYPITPKTKTQNRHYYIIPKMGSRFIENPIGVL